MKSKTLIIYLHGAGDCVMLSGVLKKYRELHPEEEVSLLLKAGCEEVMTGNPHIDQFHLYYKPQPHFWNPFRYYLGLEFAGMARLRATWKAGGFSKVILSEIQTMPEVFYDFTGTYHARHKIERICDDLGVPRAMYPYDIYTLPEHQSAARQFLAGVQPPFAMLHPFSAGARRRMPDERIKAVLQALGTEGLTPILVGSRSEAEGVKHLLNPRVVPCFGLPLKVVIEILKLTGTFVGTDSLIAHLAGVAGVKHITIHSPHPNPQRYAPISEGSELRFVRL